MWTQRRRALRRGRKSSDLSGASHVGSHDRRLFKQNSPVGYHLAEMPCLTRRELCQLLARSCLVTTRAWRGGGRSSPAKSGPFF